MGTEKHAESAPVDAVVRLPQLLKIEPQPKWEEVPMLSDDGHWCGRYLAMKMLCDGVDFFVEVDAIRPPINKVVPIEQDGVWYWDRNIDDGKCECGQNWYTCVCTHDDD
jgi:hypothetical protein